MGGQAGDLHWRASRLVFRSGKWPVERRETVDQLKGFAGTTGSTRCAIALCAVLGLILSAVLSARTEGKASPGRIWPEITALRAAYTTCSYSATPSWKDRRNGIRSEEHTSELQSLRH